MKHRLQMSAEFKKKVIKFLMRNEHLSLEGIVSTGIDHSTKKKHLVEAHIEGISGFHFVDLDTYHSVLRGLDESKRGDLSKRNESFSQHLEKDTLVSKKRKKRTSK